MRDGGSSLGSGSSRRTVVRDVCGDAGRYGGSYLNSLYHLHVISGALAAKSNANFKQMRIFARPPSL